MFERSESQHIRVSRTYVNGELIQEIVKHSENLADRDPKELAEQVMQGTDKLFQDMDNLFQGLFGGDERIVPRKRTKKK